MNEYGAMVEWYLHVNTEVLGEKHDTLWVVDGWMCVEQRWNGTHRGILKYWEKTRHTVGGRWMNKYGTMVEWYLQGNTELLGEKYGTLWVVDG